MGRQELKLSQIHQDTKMRVPTLLCLLLSHAAAGRSPVLSQQQQITNLVSQFYAGYQCGSGSQLAAFYSPSAQVFSKFDVGLNIIGIPIFTQYAKQPFVSPFESISNFEQTGVNFMCSILGLADGTFLSDYSVTNQIYYTPLSQTTGSISVVRSYINNGSSYPIPIFIEDSFQATSCPQTRGPAKFLFTSRDTTLRVILLNELNPIFDIDCLQANIANTSTVFPFTSEYIQLNEFPGGAPACGVSNRRRLATSTVTMPTSDQILSYTREINAATAAAGLNIVI